MLWLATTILFISTLLLGRQLVRTRRLMRGVEASIRDGHRFLPEASRADLERMGVAQLIDSVNDLVTNHKESNTRENGQSVQVEAMLNAVQEAVIIYGEDRTIEYANHSAESLFRGGRSIRGSRLEGVFRSLTLLELLDRSLSSGQTESAQVSIDHGNQLLWFEATCSKVKRPGERLSESTLLVLHNITQLKALEAMRREFVANVSHELRTPLTIIKGFTETLIDDSSTIDPKARDRFLTKIQTNAERLHVLVEDLLTLSRLESRPDQIEKIEQPFEPLFHEVAENYRSRLDLSHQKIEVVFDPAIGRVAYDRHRLNQVLDNFIENVFRYAPNFTCIKIEAILEPSSKLVICSVSDDGPGIPPKDLPHLFERFYRVDKGRSRETGGTGLGLSIVKHIIQLHGGSVHAESRLGEGTRMVFQIPLQDSKSALWPEP